ncbi:MAG: hypothetical protein ACKV22_19130 [Bryobacteraceae bacterium]
MGATVAVNGALLRPAPMVNEAGTVTDELLLARTTDWPPLPAAKVNVTVHEAEPPAARVDGIQLSDAGVGKTGAVTCTDPPVADNGSAVPAAVEATG